MEIKTIAKNYLNNYDLKNNQIKIMKNSISSKMWNFIVSNSIEIKTEMKKLAEFNNKVAELKETLKNEITGYKTVTASIEKTKGDDLWYETETKEVPVYSEVAKILRECENSSLFEITCAVNEAIIKIANGENINIVEVYKNAKKINLANHIGD